MRLGITGASGFVGTALMRWATAEGFDPVGVVRSRSGGSAHNDAYRTINDPWEPGSWARALGDVDGAVHLIGRAHHTDDAEDAYNAYYRDNVLVSDALMAGLDDTSVRNVVYLSSIKAVAEETHGIPIDAETAPHPTTPYGETKLEAEDRWVRWAAATSTNLAILRPPLVHGPGVKGNFRTLLRIAAAGVPLPIGGIDNRRSMISIDNLCDVILRSVSEAVSGIHRVPVADAEVLSTADVVTVLRSAMGRRPGVFRFPEPLLTSVSRVAGFEEQFRRIAGDLVIDGSAAAAELDWTPSRTAIQGLVKTALLHGAPGD